MKVFIIIVTYNGMKWIEQCLKSCSDYKVIVIDNASNDGTVDFIKKNHTQVHLFSQKTNLGFGQANNLGMSYALSQGAEFVFLLNQDAFLEQNTIENLIKVYKDNSNFALLSPIHLNGNGTKLDKGFSSYMAYEKNNYFYYDAIKKNLSKIYEVPYVNAAAWLLPKKTLLKIGGFDSIFFHYGEDDNYCQRLQYHGLKIGVVTNAFVKHDREFVKYDNDIKSLKSKERYYKYRWADINIENKNLIRKRVNELKKTKFYAFFKLDFPKVKYCNNELKLIYRITKEIKKSRLINQELGKHYL